MTNKERLVLDIVKHGVMLYEVSFQGPKKYGRAIGNLDDAFRQPIDQGPRKPTLETVDATTSPSHELAEEYLEWIYNGKEKPKWLEGYKYAV